MLDGTGRRVSARQRQLARSPLLTKRPQKWRIPLSVHDALNFMIARETRECLAFALEIVTVVRGASSQRHRLAASWTGQLIVYAKPSPFM
jgi:hypothetical protein